MYRSSWMQAGLGIALAGALLAVPAGPLNAGDIYKLTDGTLNASYTGVVHYYYDSANRLVQASSATGDINVGFSMPWAVYYGYDGDKLRYERAFSGNPPGVPNEPTWSYYKLTYYEYGDDYANTTDDLGHRILPGKQLVFKREVDLKWHNTLNYAYYHYSDDGRLSSIYYYKEDYGSMLTGWDEYTYDDNGRVLYIDRWGQDSQGNWGQYLGYWGFGYYQRWPSLVNMPSENDLPMDGYQAQKTWYDANWNPVYSKNYHYAGLEYWLLYQGSIGTGKTSGIKNPPFDDNNMGTRTVTWTGDIRYTYTYYGAEFGGYTTGSVASHDTAVIYPTPDCTTPPITNFNPVDPLNLFVVSGSELMKLAEP